MRHFFTLFFIFSIFFPGLKVAAQEAAQWQLESIELLSDVLGEVTQDAQLSPDGESIAFVKRGSRELCTHNIESAETACYPLPETFARPPQWVSWSADKAYLVFTEDPFRIINESDIWVLDTEAGSFINLTDDNVEGSWFRAEEDTFALDYVPVWHPTEPLLYYFSSQRLPEGYDLRLMRLKVPDGEPELVIDLTDTLPVLSVFRRAAISPEGSQIALFVFGQQRDDARNGLWVIDLPSAGWLFGQRQAQARQIAARRDLLAGQPEWYPADQSLMNVEAIFWANDGVVAYVRDTSYSVGGAGQNMLYLDPETNAVAPVADLGDIPNNAALFQADAEGDSPLQRIPRAGFVTPDGDHLVYLHHGAALENAGLSSLALPPAGKAPVALGDIPEYKPSPPDTVNAGGRRAIIYGYLITLQAQ